MSFVLDGGQTTSRVLKLLTFVVVPKQWHWLYLNDQILLTVLCTFLICLTGLPPTPVQLLYPVSRFCNVKSLQHLCRFCIRQLIRIDHIQELPLPRYRSISFVHSCWHILSLPLLYLSLLLTVHWICFCSFCSRPLIAYLKKFYYYDPEEEMYLSVKGMRQMAGVEQESESET